MRLDDPSIQTFLATREIAVLATLQPDGAPLAMPMWFFHDARAITMISVNGLQKVKNLRRDPRASVVRVMPPNRVLFQIKPDKVRAWGLS